jgi:hypothetical protein
MQNMCGKFRRKQTYDRSDIAEVARTTTLGNMIRHTTISRSHFS